MRNALIVGGFIFAVVALIHLARLIFDFSLVIGGVSIPLWANGLGFLISATLSLWMLSSTRNTT